MTFIKISMVFALVVSQLYTSQAQGTRKTILEQLAALKGYIVTAEKGYRIAEEGLHAVRDVKSGEFLLHQVFFQSLKVVDEGVLQSSELRRSYWSAPTDQDLARAISAYDALMTDGILSMTDGERIRMINEIMVSLRTRYGRINRVLSSIIWLLSQRKKEQVNIETLKKWYEIQ